MRGDEVKVGLVGAGRAPGIPAPPQERGESSGKISHGIPGIAGGAHDMGADPFKENGPADEMAGDFPKAGPGVARAKPEQRVGEQNRRQRARDEEGVVKPVVEEGDVRVRFDEPPVGGVERAGQQKQRVANVAEPLQSNARMTRPAERPMRIFTRTAIDIELSNNGRDAKCDRQPTLSFPMKEAGVNYFGSGVEW